MQILVGKQGGTGNQQQQQQPNVSGFPGLSPPSGLASTVLTPEMLPPQWCPSRARQPLPFNRSCYRWKPESLLFKPSY